MSVETPKKPENVVIPETPKKPEKTVPDNVVTEIPESDKIYRLSKRFRQFKEMKGFDSLGEIWEIQWKGMKGSDYAIQFNMINGNCGFDKATTIKNALNINAGIIAALCGFKSVDAFEKTFKPLD